MESHSRRQFMSGAAASTLLPLLKTSKAYGAGNVAPLRLILVRSPFQYSEPFYHPWTSSTNSALAPQGSNFYLNYANSSLAPLAPYQSDLQIFRGLNHATPGHSHSTYFTTFSGATVIPDPNSGTNDRCNGTSIDHYLFRRMGHVGSLSPAIIGALTGLFSSVTGYSINAGAASPETLNPRSLWNVYFRNFNPGSSSLTPQNQRRKFVLDLAQARLQGMMNRLPTSAPSYTVLQSHLAAAQGLNQQLSGNSGMATSCQKPLESSILNDSGPENGSFNGCNAAAVYSSFNTVITQMLACDLTRIVSFDMGSGPIHGSDNQIGDAIIYQEIPELKMYPDFHGSVSHGTTGSITNPLDVAMGKWQAYFVGKVAKLLASLKAVADPYSPTQSLYDNTVVLIASEGPCVTNGSDVHNAGTNGAKSDWPFIIAGGCGGYFKKGQLIFAGGSKAPTLNHNAVLTNVVNAFEKNQQQFNPAFMPNFISQYGDYAFGVSPTTWLAP